VSRNVKRWRSASMALRWTAAAMLEAKTRCDTYGAYLSKNVPQVPQWSQRQTDYRARRALTRIAGFFADLRRTAEQSTAVERWYRLLQHV
jgi:hypothetical protein